MHPPFERFPSPRDTSLDKEKSDIALDRIGKILIDYSTSHKPIAPSPVAPRHKYMSYDPVITQEHKPQQQQIADKREESECSDS